MNASTNAIKNFNRTSGLGTISFSSELISSIIKKVLNSYPHFKYFSHSIKEAVENYYEVSVLVLTPTRDMYMKEIERLQKELLIVFKQSLSLNCVVFLNISYGK